MTDPINLQQLRADYEGWTGIVEIEVDTALALIDVAEAANENENARARDTFGTSYVIPPEVEKLNDALSRFDFEQS